jgi:hypothetical protein
MCEGLCSIPSTAKRKSQKKGTKKERKGKERKTARKKEKENTIN